MRRLFWIMLLLACVAILGVVFVPEKAISWQEPAYDQLQGTAGASQDAGRHSDWQQYERAREDASEGFDTETDNRIPYGNQYIPMPTPRIDEDYSNTKE